MTNAKTGGSEEHFIDSREEHLHKKSAFCRCNPYRAGNSGEYWMHKQLKPEESKDER